MYLNCNIKPIECYVRKEYLYNLEKGHGDLIEATAFAIKSCQGQAILFYVMLADTGAVYDKIPISALVPFNKDKAEHLPFHVLQMWDCFSYHVSCTEFMFLKGKRAQVFLKNRKKVEGIYRFTLDWSSDGTEIMSASYSEEPAQHKCAHVIELESGHFCAYPNNRILWNEPSMVSEPFKNIPDYKLNEQKYNCESYDKWGCDESDNFVYDTVEGKEDGGV